MTHQDKRPAPETLQEWHVIASPLECYIEGAGMAISSRTGKFMKRRCEIRYSENAADTWFGRWTVKVAPRNQEHRIKARKPRNAEEYRYVRDVVVAALASVTNADLQVWSEGRAPHLTLLRTRLLESLPV